MRRYLKNASLHARLPRRLNSVKIGANFPRQNEKVIGQSVDITNNNFFHRTDFGEMHNIPLSSSAHATCNMAYRGNRMAARQYETPHFGQCFIHRIDGIFKKNHIIFVYCRDFSFTFFRIRSQVRAECKQTVLYFKKLNLRVFANFLVTKQADV